MQGEAALKSLLTLSGASRGSGDVFMWIDAALCFEKVWKWLLVGERQQMAQSTLAALKGTRRAFVEDYHGGVMAAHVFN